MALIQIGTTVGVLLGTLVSLSILSSVIGAVGGGTKEILVGETAILGAAAYNLHTSEIIGLPLAATIVLLPLFTQVFAYLWFMYVGKKVLSVSTEKRHNGQASLSKKKTLSSLRQ